METNLGPWKFPEMFFPRNFHSNFCCCRTSEIDAPTLSPLSPFSPLAPAQFCNYDLESTPPSDPHGGLGAVGQAVGGGLGRLGGLNDLPMPGALLKCANGMYEEQMNCTNTSGSMALTCPKKESVAACRYYDTYNKNWTDDNCTYWYSDYENGYAVCNCTHLTDFSAQQEDTFSEQTTTFTDTAVSVTDLSLTDLAKNWHIVTVLLLIWVFCLGLYYRDKRTRKVLVMKYIVGMYRNEKMQKMLKNLDRVEGAKPADVDGEEPEVVEITLNPMAQGQR